MADGGKGIINNHFAGSSHMLNDFGRNSFTRGQVTFSMHCNYVCCLFCAEGYQTVYVSRSAILSRCVKMCVYSYKICAKEFCSLQIISGKAYEYMYMVISLAVFMGTYIENHVVNCYFSLFTSNC